MGRRILEKDWSATPLGPIETWPQTLRTALGMCLATRFPMFIYWGPERMQLYNDAGIPIMGAKHPHDALCALRDVFPAQWSFLKEMFEGIERTGQAGWAEDQPMPLVRSGFIEELYFTWSYTPVRDDSGAVVGFYTPAVETTGQVLGQRRLRTLHAITSRAAGALSTEDACRAVLSALAENPADLPFAQLFLLNEDGTQASLRGSCGDVLADPQGRPRVELRAEPAGDGFERLLGEVARTRQAKELKDVGAWLPLRSVPGSLERPRSALALPVLSSDGHRALGLLVVGLSPHLVLEGEYRHFLELTAGSVSTVVSSAHAQQEARARVEKLAALDRAKTAFFSNVSHEFRTPLTLMLGPLEDALTEPDAPLSPHQRECLLLAQRNALRLLKLVNNVLDFTRLEAGRATAVFRPTDLSALTIELVSHFESAAKRVQLGLSWDCPPLSAPVWVDPEMWEKVVFNLVSNALKYTFAGTLDVSLREEDGQVCLRVRDTGTGIPAAELPRIFERFHRVEGARARSVEGSGIGLSLVHELVKLHGGAVTVASVLGAGTTFTVTLPFGHAHLPQEQCQPALLTDSGPSARRAAVFVQEMAGWVHDAGDEEEAAPALPRARVLVVDDNADLRTYISGLLQRLFQVETVRDGVEALRAIERQPPDLILSDVMMPRLGGFGLLKQLRKDPLLRAIPFILLSARAGEESSVEGLEAGADDYLVKPFSGRELVARIRTQLEMAQVRQEVAAHAALEKSLTEALRARDDFLSVVSHELKTPLAAFRLQFELIERGLSEESRARMAERFAFTRRQVQRLATVVETLLDVSQLTSGALTLKLETLDVSALVAEVIEGMREEVARVGGAVTFTADPAVRCRVDRTRLGQVLRHLLSNALKYGQGKPIEVGLHAEGPLARLSVVDHGLGIHSEHRERIWGRFERAVSRNYGGLGLGLWISRQLVEAQGGSISVMDTPGGGASFTVELALQQQPGG